jgi:hypothetical protein
MIPRQKALASTAAGSHHLINFDADSAGHAARLGRDNRPRCVSVFPSWSAVGKLPRGWRSFVEFRPLSQIAGEGFEFVGLELRECLRNGQFKLLVGLGTIKVAGLAQAGKVGRGDDAEAV